MARIRDVKAAKAPVEIQIRVIRKWRLKSKQEICYLFVDAHGDSIEATADLNKEAFLDSKLKLQECYTISNYIAIESRNYMRVVPNETSIRLGDKVVFQAISTTEIPTDYYCFATYDQLDSRKKHPRPLTNYIGRVEKVSPILDRGGKMIRKATIQDTESNFIEITFWTETMFPYDQKQAEGQLLAVTSTIVTEYRQKLQVESSSATIAVLNPQIPDLPTYNKFKQVMKASTSTSDSILAIGEIFDKFKDDKSRTQFTCKASITEIITNRKWFYVNCSSCKRKLFLEIDDKPKFVCEDHGEIPEPKFMYCVNTTIADESKDAKAIFFNEAMSNLLNISCKYMVVLHGYTDPKIIPPEIYAVRGKTTILQISMKDVWWSTLKVLFTHIGNIYIGSLYQQYVVKNAIWINCGPIWIHEMTILSFFCQEF